MTFNEFEQYAATILGDIQKLRETKGLEYTDGKERFMNFNRTAARTVTPRLKVAMIFLDKHMLALESYINRGQVFSDEHIHSRITDILNYVLLIGGMIAEDQSKQDQP